MPSVEAVVRPEETATAGRVTLGTWLRFLAGGREAILQVARSPQALWLGLAFVLSTGFAREYDGADLRSEPWHLILPLVASLGTSLVLWILVYVVAACRDLEQLQFRPGYRTLLTFYWMTAPLAWIYAIPVERFLSPGDATAANFYFLAIVSACRVLLITRALSVWLSANYFAMFFIVAFFADSVAVLLALASPMPIFNVMGGIRHSDVDRVILEVLMNVKIFGLISWPVWLIGALVVLGRKSPWTVTAFPQLASHVSKPLWAFAVSLIILGMAILPSGQPQQQHAHEANALLRTDEIDSAVRYLAKLKRSDLPPIWDPPPRIGYGEGSPEVMAVLESIVAQNAPQWLSKIYVEKLQVDPRSTFESAIPFKGKVDSPKLIRLLTIYERFVPMSTIDDYSREELVRMADDERIEADLRKRMFKYLELPAAKHVSEPLPAEEPAENQP